MRTTDAKADARTEGIRTRRVTGRAVAIVVAVVAVAAFLADFAFGAYATLSTVAWSDFWEADHIDCLFVGPSYAQRAFDPVEYDEQMGTESINLATPGQMMRDTLDAVTIAVDEKSLDHVILGLGVGSLSDGMDAQAHVPYLRAKYAGQPMLFAIRMAEMAIDPDVRGTEASLNVLFPWTFTSVKSLPGIASNIVSKVTGEEYGSAAEKTTPGWHYVGKGYGNYDWVVGEGDRETTMSVYGKPVIDDEYLRQLADVCDMCATRGIRLTVVATPHPSYDILSVGDLYPEMMGRVQSVVEGHGGTYWDLSMVRDDGTLDLSLGDFGDYEHLNLDGARKVTDAVADLVTEQDEGGDTSSHFFPYDEWDEWVGKAEKEEVEMGR